MSIKTIAALAVKRDLGVAWQGWAAAPPEPEAPVAVPAAAPAAPAPALPDTSGLTAVLPTEVIGLYTAAIAVVQGVLGEPPVNKYVPLRWGIFAAGFFLVALFVIPSHRTLALGAGWQVSKGSLRMPLVVAMLAYGVWAIVTPGSALYFVLAKPGLTVTVGIVTLAGSGVVGYWQSQLRSSPRR